MSAFFEWIVGISKKLWALTVLLWGIGAAMFKVWNELLNWSVDSLGATIASWGAAQTTATGGIASASSSFEAKITMLADFLVAINTFVPVDYAISAANWLLTAYILAVIVRSIKSWIPTVAG